MMITKRIGRTSALAFTLAASLTAMGCGDDGDGTDTPDAGVVDPTPDAMVGTPASLAIAPSTPDFGSVVVGTTSAATTITVTNAGENASSALTIDIGGTNAGDFAITNDTCNGNTLAGSATCTIDVTFTAGASGQRTASLNATAATGGSATAALRGVGADPAALSVGPTPHGFGDVVINATSSDVTFTVTNDGDQDSGTISANLAGGDAIHFAIVTNNCDGQTLAANATCTVIAHFAPTSSGNKTTTLSVTSSPGGTVTASLTGNGLVDAALEISPLVQDFGSVTQGSSSSNVTLVVTNNGDVDTSTLTSGLGGTNAADFNVSADTCANTIVAAGGTCTIVLNFAPQSTGNLTASFDVSATTGGAASTVLNGIGLAPGSISIGPTPHTFADATVGTTGPQQVFTVTNNGGSPTGSLGTALNGANPTDFPIVAGSNGCQGRVLPAGGTCTIAIAFSPILDGNRTAALTVTGVPGGVAPAALSGRGLTPAVLNVAPPAWDFGSVGTDVTSAPQTFTVTNEGDTTSGAITAEILGTNFSHFNLVTNNCGAPLASGASCTVVVDFGPSTTGDKVATLEVVANPGGTHNSILNGNGITPGQLLFSSLGGAFGSGIVDSNSPTNQVWTITNSGQAPTEALATSITGEYTIQTDNCVGVVLNATESCTIAVRFEPRGVAGNRPGSLTISGTPGGTINGAFSGSAVDKITVVPGPTFHFTPGVDAVKFEETRPATFTVTNNSADFGTRNRTFTRTVANTGATEWSMVNPMIGACPSTGGGLTPGNSCTLDVVFAPQTANGAPGTRTSTLTIVGSGGGDSGTAAIALSGDAAGPLTITQTGGACNPSAGQTFYAMLGDTVVNNETVSCFEVTNTAVVGANTGAMSVTLTPRGDFAILSDACSGLDLDGQESCIVEVIFFPRSSGLVDFDLKARSTASFEATTTVSATGLSAAKLDWSADTTDDFGPVVSTNNRTLSFTVTNLGDENAMSVTAGFGCGFAVGPTCNSALFRKIGSTSCNGTVTTGVGADPTDLATGESCTIQLIFEPLVTTAPQAWMTYLYASGTAELTNDDADDDFSANAQSVSQLSIDLAPTYDFGDQLLGTTSAPVVFTVTNNGSQPVAGATVDTSPIGSLVFQIPGATNTCSTIPAGGGCTFEVTYTPSILPAAHLQQNTAGLTVGANVGATATMNVTGNPLDYPELSWKQDFTSFPGFDAGFGGTTTGTPGAIRTFTLQNKGDSPTTGGIATTLGGAGVAHYTVTDNCNGVVLAALVGECTYVVQFTPVSPTVGDQTLTILANTSNVSPFWDSGATLSVQGRATATSSFTISPAMHDFGHVIQDLGTLGPRTTFVVTNNAATAQAPNPTVQSNGGFVIVTSGVDRCTTATIAPGASCNIYVRYQPTGDRVENYGGVSAGTAVAGVFGFSDRKATLQLSTTTVSFTGTTGIGSTPTMTVTITNIGDETAGALGFTVGGAVPSAYNLSGCAGTALAPTESCDLVIEFAPAGAGLMAAFVTVGATPGGGASAATITLSGTGGSQAALGITPQALQNCRNGNIPANTDVPAGATVVCDETYTISNNTAGVATGKLAIDVADPNFTVTGGSCVNNVTVLDGVTPCTVVVSYNPLTVATHNGILSVTAAPGGTVTAPLTGVSVPALSPDSTSLNFGSTVDVDCPTNNSQTVTFTNATGTASTTPLTVNMTGADFFLLDDTCSGQILGSNGTCTVTTRFVPITSAPAGKSGTIVVSDGTGNKTAATVNLVGTADTDSCAP